MKTALPIAVVAEMSFARLVFHARGNVNDVAVMNDNLGVVEVEFASALILDTLFPGTVEHWDRIARARSIDAATKAAITAKRDEIADAMTCTTDKFMAEFRSAILAGDLKAAARKAEIMQY